MTGDGQARPDPATDGPSPRDPATDAATGLGPELFVAGRWVRGGGGTVDLVSPHDESRWARADMASVADVDRAVAAARAAFDDGPWPRCHVDERLAALRRLADRYHAGIEQMAGLVTAEMGSPMGFSRLGQSWAAWALIDTTIGVAESYDWEEVRPARFGGHTLVRGVPVGVVAAITPWNVPQITIVSKLVPALVAGCTVVVKPSPETPLDALLLARWVEEAGVPPGVVSVVPGGPDVGEHLVRHRGVDKVAFTGSTAAGRRIGAICGEQVRRVGLELGGKSAAVVLDDADASAVAAGLRFASFMNSGQACAAQTRVLVPRRRHDELVDALAEMATSLVIGDPSDETTEIGPMVSLLHRDRVLAHVQRGLAEGAKAAAGGPDRPGDQPRGWYVRPTILTGVTNAMAVARQEIFGPVVVVIPHDGDDAAVALANDSDYGLAGSVWTADEQRGLDVARRLRTGMVGVNKFAPDLSAPFGGFKASGIGREYGREGLESFLEVQSLAP